MRNSRAQEMTMEVTVGAFMFMVLLALGVFTIILSSGTIFKDTYPMTVIFEDVMGLRAGDNVQVRGVEVGTVDQIRLTEEGVELDLSLDKDVRLRTDYEISIIPSSVLGGKHVEIYQGTPGHDFIGEEAVVRGETPIDFVDQASKTINQVRESLEEGGILENLEQVMAQMRDVTAGLSEGKGTIGKLLADDAVYNDLKDITRSLKQVSTNLAEGNGTLGRLMQDDQVYEDIEHVSANLREISRRLVDGEGTIGRLLSEDDELYRNLLEASAAVKDIAADIRDGEGTIGKLAQDDEVYQEIKLVLHDLRGAIDDFRETAPITTFTSIFFGAF